MGFFNTDFLPQYLKLLLFFGFFWIVWVRVPDLSFFIGLILKALRMKSTDSRFDAYNNELYAYHLFKLRHGVNVKTINDAVLVNDALHKGIIERKLLWFSSYFGPVGVKRTKSVDGVFGSLIALLFIATSIGMFWLVHQQKSGYATYNSNPKMMVSRFYVYEPENDIYHNKTNCLTLKSNESDALKAACNYLTTADIDLKSELAYGISSEKRSGKLALTLISIFFLLGFALLIGVWNFIKLNKIICDLKEANYPIPTNETVSPPPQSAGQRR